MPNDHSPNYYMLLELSPTAGDADIKKAWREQLQVWHPDRFMHAPALHQKAEARTKLINQAYETLSDRSTRARYDVTIKAAPSQKTPTTTSPPTYAATPPTSAETTNHERRGPQSPIVLTKEGQGTMMVPAIHLYIDPKEPHPYDFHGFTRIAGTIREPLPVGNYAIAEAPELLAIKTLNVEVLYTVLSNPLNNREPFILELERMRPYQARVLLVEGTLQHKKGSGRLHLYHKHGLMDFLDALTARFGLQIVYADTRDEAEERIANLAALHYSYYFADQMGFGRCLTENDV